MMTLAYATVQVPALNLSTVARDSPTKSPSRALQPAEYDSNNSALVFKQPKKVSLTGLLQLAFFVRFVKLCSTVHVQCMSKLPRSLWCLCNAHVALSRLGPSAWCVTGEQEGKQVHSKSGTRRS